MRDPLQFFPGDPPLVEWLAILLFLVGLGLLVLLLLPLRKARSLSRVALVVGLLAPLPAILAVRHSGPWKALQRRLIAFEAEARLVHVQCRGDRACKINYFDLKYGTTTFQFTPQHGPVQLTFWVGDDVRPAVHFGRGATAVFDSTWMLTIYSD